jgi:hypothetical protein
MRIDIFPRGGSPETHERICRQSLRYCEDMVVMGMLALVDPNDIRKGCVVVGPVKLREDEILDRNMLRASGWGFSSAWSMRPSGPTGICVWQLNTR